MTLAICQGNYNSQWSLHSYLFLSRGYALLVPSIHGITNVVHLVYNVGFGRIFIFLIISSCISIEEKQKEYYVI